jgi:hypothetical protein
MQHDPEDSGPTTQPQAADGGRVPNDPRDHRPH